MRDQSSTIIFKKTYTLDDDYESIKGRATRVLGQYLTPTYQGLIVFDNEARSVTFSTERLIPTVSTNRPRVMLLFSNPHPYSVRQGMFLSPNAKGGENLFWPVMEEAGWLPIPKENRKPKQLADICLAVNYDGPFELVFYCYYAFPTAYPEEIRKIFGKSYFSQFIEPEARAEFRKTIQDTSVQAVVTFNKSIFNLTSRDRVDRYVARIREGQQISSEIAGIDQSLPIFLTFPTGWFFDKEFMRLRKDSLERIRVAIHRELSLRGSKNR
jgi:hypothetical protein